MRILFTAHQFFPEHYAGTEVLTLGIARELKSRGHEPFVLAAKRSIPGSGIEPGEVEDYEFHGIPVRRVGRPKEGPNASYRLDFENETMAERAREYVDEVKPDVAHAMHFQGLSASIIPIFREAGVPLVYTATDFWAVCPVVDLRRHDGVMCEGPEITHCIRCVSSRNPSSWLSSFVNRMPDAAIRTAEDLSETGLSRASRQLRQVGAIKERPEYIRRKLHGVDRFIAPTKLMKKLLVANGIQEEKISTSHYGIDTSHLDGVARNTSVPPPLRVGFMGTLSPHKGCDTLVRAFGELSKDIPATLTIYGNLERFRANVKKLRRLAGDDERIKFAGTFPPELIGQTLSEMDVLVVPSRWYENTPLVVYSAFASGTPVVATDLGGLSEVIEHGRDGLLFGLEDYESLSRQLKRLAEEPGLLEQLRAGIGPVKTIGQDVEELEEVYASLRKKDGTA